MTVRSSVFGTNGFLFGSLCGRSNGVAAGGSGVEAVLLLKKTRYDLLITDLMMPEGTGFSLNRGAGDDDCTG